MDKPEALRLAAELDQYLYSVPAHPLCTDAAAVRRDRAQRAEAQRDALLEQRDELRRALEIIAVGDATNPQAQAAEELIALGYWRDIPEARAAIRARSNT